MLRAALYVGGRIVVGHCHLDAYQQLSEAEKDSHLVSGFYDSNSEEFKSDMDKDHFYNKEMVLVRHGRVEVSDSPDPDLSDEGRGCVQLTTQTLKKNQFEDAACFVSPMLRCLRTAAIIQEAMNVRFKIMPEVMETPSLTKSDEGFCVKNRHDQFPQFDWPQESDWCIPQEDPATFMSRVKETLKQLPTRSIVVTHYGYICNMAKIALCDDRAKLMIEQGIPTASVTYINKQVVRRLGP